MANAHGRRLLVEGHDDLYAIAELIGAFTPWPNKKDLAPVEILPQDGANQILAEGTITAHAKATGVRTVGVIIDADEDASTRWQAIRQRCAAEFPSIPEDCPRNGCIVENSSGRRLGVWIMPDNQTAGMLETFLSRLIFPNDLRLWSHAVQATSASVSAGSRFLATHQDKACIHAWLAWQNPPGLAFGTAVLRGYLDPNSPAANEFVKWFLGLFELPPHANTTF